MQFSRLDDMTTERIQTRNLGAQSLTFADPKQPNLEQTIGQRRSTARCGFAAKARRSLWKRRSPSREECEGTEGVKSNLVRGWASEGWHVCERWSVVAAATFEGEGRKGGKKGSSFRFSLSLSASGTSQPAIHPHV